LSTSNACILTVNGGSSSIKFALFEAGGGLWRILAGQFAGIGLSEGTFSVKAANNADNVSRRMALPDYTTAVNSLMDWIQVRSDDRGELMAVGHRVVDGDTSMSFTPTAGLPMSTRTGDLDPSLSWYLEQTEKMPAREFHHMINHECGLLGVSELSSDMQELLSKKASDPRAAEAVALFCYQAKKWILRVGRCTGRVGHSRLLRRHR